VSRFKEKYVALSVFSKKKEALTDFLKDFDKYASRMGVKYDYPKGKDMIEKMEGPNPHMNLFLKGDSIFDVLYFLHFIKEKNKEVQVEYVNRD